MNLATLCYLREPTQTLFLHRNKKENDFLAGYYVGIGGKVGELENLDSCVRREFAEETGLTIHDPLLKGYLQFENPDNDNWLVAIYVATKYSGQIVQSREGEVMWVDNNKIMDLNLLEGDKIFLPYVFESEFFHGTFKYRVEDGKKKLYEPEIKKF